MGLKPQALGMGNQPAENPSMKLRFPRPEGTEKVDELAEVSCRTTALPFSNLLPSMILALPMPIAHSWSGERFNKVVSDRAADFNDHVKDFSNHVNDRVSDFNNNFKNSLGQHRIPCMTF
jgi:hypothetical protein